MLKIKLSLFQLFSLMVLFELGSAVVVGLGVEAGADAWLAVMVGLLISLVLLCSFAHLYYHYPQKPLTVFVLDILGKPLGTLVAILYTCYFLYIGARVLRDFSELISMNLLDGTPMLVISLCMMALIAYSLYLGIEVIGRTGEIFMFLTFFVAGMFLFFICISGKVKLENLQPFLEKGFLPVVQAAFPTITTFPFGESIVFLMFFCFVNETNKWRAIRVGIGAVVVSGMLLCITTLTNIVVLGPYLFSHYQFPLLEAIARVNIDNFIQRLDPLIIILLITGGYFKIVVFFAATVLGFASFNKNKHMNSFIWPVFFIMVTLSVAMASNLVEHLQIGLKVVPWMLHIPFQFGIPTFLCLVLFIKNRLKKRALKNGINM